MMYMCAQITGHKWERERGRKRDWEWEWEREREREQEWATAVAKVPRCAIRRNVTYTVTCIFARISSINCGQSGGSREAGQRAACMRTGAKGSYMGHRRESVRARVHACLSE